MANANPDAINIAPTALNALLVIAEGQVRYWRDRQAAEKCLEDGFSEEGEHTPIGDDAAWSGGYCNGRYSEADWWLKTLRSAATPNGNGYRIRPRGDGSFEIEREMLCINGLRAWFSIATVHAVSDEERLATDGEANSAEENANALLVGLTGQVDGGQATPDVMGQDGTERLCQVLYGRKARARDYLGGSDARMLHDAADRLATHPLVATDDPKAGRFGHRPDRADDFCAEVEALQAEWQKHRLGIPDGAPSLSQFRERVSRAMDVPRGADRLGERLTSSFWFWTTIV